MTSISFGTLRISIAPTVYEPAEDSFLLATYASSISGGKKILEMGCGTGIVSLAAAHADAGNEVTGADINPAAVECAKGNAEQNGMKNCKFIQSDLFASLPAASKFDFILFNPPYLPTTREEKLALGDENAAYDGGESGLETFYRFASQARAHLATRGRVATISTSLNDGIKKSLAEMEKRIGPAKTLAEEKFFFEKIALIEAVKW